MSDLQGFYVSFSGEEGSKPINNVYALSPTGSTVSTQVLDPTQTYQELRGIVFGPDGKLYVAQAYKKASAILQFSAAVNPKSSTRAFLAKFATPSASGGLLHPYQSAFGTDGNLYVASQDTNVVTAFYGPANASAGRAMLNSKFLQKNYPAGTFNPGTFVPAFSAAPGVPPFTPVPVTQGGLTFTTTNSSATNSSTTKSSQHSVRGIAFDSSGCLYVADEGNNRVAVFDASGTFLGAITQSKDHALSEPVALCIDPTGATLYIGSPGNERLFTYDVANVAHAKFDANVLIHDADRLKKLSGIAVDPSGHLYTCSRESNCIYQWKADGSFHSNFAGPFNDTPEQMIGVYSAISG